MRKIGSLGLMIGASIVAVSAGSFIFLAFAADKSGQMAEQVADAGSAPILDRPDWKALASAVIVGSLPGRGRSSSATIGPYASARSTQR